MSEKAVLFGNTRSLVGIITDPPESVRDNNLPAIILLNAGILHRVGPHRLYVKMTRNLATMGFVVLRFDFSGIGDSKVRHDNLPFEKSAISETQEAMGFLSTEKGIERFLLIGLCSGAVSAFQTACSDPRAVGAVLINIHRLSTETSEESSYFKNRRLAREYWKRYIFSGKSWLKAITGKSDYRSIMRAMSFQLRSRFSRTQKQTVSSIANKASSALHLLTERDVRLLFVYDEGDSGLDYLHVTLRNKNHELSSFEKLRTEVIPHAGHTFTLLRSQEHLLKVVHDWADAIVQG